MTRTQLELEARRLDLLLETELNVNESLRENLVLSDRRLETIELASQAVADLVGALGVTAESADRYRNTGLLDGVVDSMPEVFSTPQVIAAAKRVGVKANRVTQYLSYRAKTGKLRVVHPGVCKGNASVYSKALDPELLTEAM